jgi:acetyl-CoA acetyltransferase
MSVLAAGRPTEVPGTTVNRSAASVERAVIFAAQAIASGFHDLVVAAGVESTSRWLAASAPLGAGNERMRAHYPMVHQGIAAVSSRAAKASPVTRWTSSRS